MGGAFVVCRDGMPVVVCTWGWVRAVLFDGKWGEGVDSMLKDDICQKNLG